MVGREDDHPGAALEYYASRGETPLRWAGAGAGRLGLSGQVTAEAYEAAFGVGGFRHPATGAQLVTTRRPGFELVVSAHKSVAVLGVVDRADDMHSILDAETTATLDWLDDWFQDRGGRRGRAQQRTPTGGLVCAVTRHATSRAGDPSPHDHVLVANVAEMLDDRGGFKGLDSASLRDTVEAATMVGRLHSAWRAVELGFAIEADEGASGNLRHWSVTGIPGEVCDTFSKRADAIADHLASRSFRSYRARGIAARATREVKRHTSVEQLLPRWHRELDDLGWPLDRLRAHLTASQAPKRPLVFPLTFAQVEAIAAGVLDIGGSLLANHKAFTRSNLIAELAPRLYGHDPAELDRVLAHVLSSRDVVPLIGIGAREQAYTTTEVLTTEATIARTVERLAERTGPTIAPERVDDVVRASESTRGHRLTAGQRRVVERLCGSGQAVSIVVGVAGSGKTTAIDTATRALEAAGYRVLGTSTSGQTARTLGTEAGVEARTFASLLWRLDHDQITLDPRTVVVVDEAGMADDVNLARLTLAIERAGGALVLVGDHRQLAAVGPGGALAALLTQRPDLVVTLDQNVRQRDLDERRALAQLRDGSVPEAVAWYARHDRIHVEPDRLETLVAMTSAWAHDIEAGHQTALLAWRRDDVADLNRLARQHWHRLGRLEGDDVRVAGGRAYAVGERLVALAPNPEAGIVTSEPLTVVAAHEDSLVVCTSDDRTVPITGDGLDAQHLDYGYAVTIHRSQGATYHRAHVLAAGGGRELGYVAMSRARDHTTLHATADGLTQAVDDIQADWGVAHHQRWITDGPARPGQQPEPARRRPPATTPPRPPVPEPPERSASKRRAATQHSLMDLHHDLDALLTGTGRWVNTPAGSAARNLTDAQERLAQARRAAADPGSRRRDRRAATKDLLLLHDTVVAAEVRWGRVGEPEAERIRNQIEEAIQREGYQLGRARLVERLDRLSTRDSERAVGRAHSLGL